MKPPSPPRSLQINKNSARVLHDAPGTLVACVSGCVWLTQYGDFRDHVLQAGDSFRIEVNGCVVMTAQADAQLQLVAPCVEGQSHPARMGWLAGLLLMLAPRWYSAVRRLPGQSIPGC